MMCCTVMANAQNSNATKIGNIYYILDGTNKTATVTWGGEEPNHKTPDYTGTITIPPTITYDNEDYKVISIGWSAFNNCSDLTSVTIPNSVTSVGKESFVNCKSLTSITIPNSVTSIGEYAFSNCESLTSVNIPNLVTSIETSTFQWCSKLASVTIPNSVTSIEQNAFWRCDSLTSVIIPSSVKNIGASVFYGCESLALVLWDGDVPEELPRLNPNDDTGMFDGCTNLQKLVVCDRYAEAYKGRFSSYREKVENLSKFIEDALTEIPNAQKSITYDLTDQDKKLIQDYIAAITKADTPGAAFTNKKCALGIISLRPMKNRFILEIDWNVSRVEEILTDEDKAAIARYVDAINVATDEETLATLRLSALNVIYLREAKINAITELNALDAGYRGIDFSPYKDAVTNATLVDEVNNILDTVRAIINNGKFATIGLIKYLLNEVGGEYRYDGDITINDKDIYQSDYSFTVTGSITYNRTFTNKNWQALYVPFAISYSDWGDDFDVAAINNFHEYTDEKGQTIKTELEIRMVKSGTLKPNHPYLIKAHDAAAEPLQIELTTKEISNSAEKSYSCSSMESQYTFTGTYQKMNKLKANDYIFMSGGKLCKAEDDEIVLSPQRWYLKITSLGSQVDGGNTSYAKAKEFDIKLLDDEPTGIDEITVTRTPLKNISEAIYNLNGMRVNGNYKGIVIKNGKKMYQR